MKVIPIVLLLWAVTLAFGAGGHCACKTAGPNERTRAGSWQIPIEEKRVFSAIRGTAKMSDMTVEDVLVEVFDNPDALTDLFHNRINFQELKSKQKRVAACMTGEDGEFCFEGLPSGRYEVRLSRELFETSFVIVTVDPESRANPDRKLKVLLQPGV